MRVVDRMAITDKNNFYAPGELGKTRRLTPEGFLICENVLIARTGEQQYHASEFAPAEDGKLEILPDGSGIVTVSRIPEEVFAERTIASFEGKSITMEHPDKFVTPDTWRELTIGTVHNVRRGEGIEDDMLVADLIIKDAGAISYVNKYMPELSCGYDADYDQTEPGKAIQRNIIGNHVALVDRGRAGPRCAIKDHLTEDLEDMAKRKVLDGFKQLFTAFQTKDDALMLKAITTMDEGGDDETETQDKVMDARLKDALDWIDKRKAKDEAEEKKKVEDAEKEEEEKKKVEDKKAKDAVLSAESNPPISSLGTLYTGDTLAGVIAKAEILSPGIKRPTKDSAVADAVPELMLASVKAAYANEATKDIVEPFLMGNPITAVTKDNVPGIFFGAATVMESKNKLRPGKVATQDWGKPTSTETLQQNINDFWSKRKSSY